MALLSLNLWNTTAGYGSVARRLDYLTDEQNCRLERIRVARLLWQGRHRQMYLAEGRTQFDFTRLRAQGSILTPYVTYNMLKLITTTITDLLIGEEPLLKAEAMQDAVNELANRSELHRVFYAAARSASWAGEAFIEAVRYDGLVYLQNLKPDELFPLGTRNPDGQFSRYRRFATVSSGQETLLLETTYGEGLITRQCFQLLGAGTAKGNQLPLARWPVKRPDGTPLADQEATGIDWPTIVWLANEDDEGQVTSDYDGLIDLQDELNHKQTQVAVVIAKHANPKMAIPQDMVDPEGNIRASHEVFFVRSKDELPSYITWNPELAAAIADREFTVQAICVAAELSPVLLGIKQGATPDAARKLRLEATKSLSRAKRKGMYLAPFIRTAIDTAMKLENAARKIALALPPSSVDLRDGLPVDELDEAQVLNLKTGGKPVMSVERAVERQLPDPEAAAVELARLKEATAAETPPILMAEPGAGAAGDQTQAQTNDNQAAVAAA